VIGDEFTASKIKYPGKTITTTAINKFVPFYDFP
jgi:hypothetical protein